MSHSHFLDKIIAYPSHLSQYSEILQFRDTMLCPVLGLSSVGVSYVIIAYGILWINPIGEESHLSTEQEQKGQLLWEGIYLS